MVVEELEMAVDGEREGMWALGQVEYRKEGVNLPLPPPPQSPQVKEMRPPQPLVASSCGVQEESQNSPLLLREQEQQQQQMKERPSPASFFSFLARGLQLARPREEGLQ